MTTPPPDERKTIHEYGPHRDLHRIVIVERNGRRSEGPWTDWRKLAHWRTLMASTDFHEGQLPVGIFRFNPIPHEVVYDVEVNRLGANPQACADKQEKPP